MVNNLISGTVTYRATMISDAIETNYANVADSLATPRAKIDIITPKDSSYVDFPTGRGATFVVAAYNSHPQSKKQADWVCDSTDDEDQIQQAINLAGLYGGIVQLSEGTFSQTKSIILDSSGVIVKGMGAKTILRMRSVEEDTIAADASVGDSVIRVKNPSWFKIGVDICIGDSDDGTLSSWVEYKAGKAFHIINITGDSLWLEDTLTDNYTIAKDAYVGDVTSSIRTRDLYGDTNGIRDITISDITFDGNIQNRPWLWSHLPDASWGTNIKDVPSVLWSIILERSQNVCIENCNFRNTGMAIGLGGDYSNENIYRGESKVKNNHFYYSHMKAICSYSNWGIQVAGNTCDSIERESFCVFVYEYNPPSYNIVPFIFSNNSVRETHQHGVRNSSAHGGIINGNIFENCRLGAIDIGRYVTVTNNEIINCAEVNNYSAIKIDDNSLVANNHLVNCVKDGIDIDGNSWVEIFNNKFYNLTGAKYLGRNYNTLINNIGLDTLPPTNANAIWNGEGFEGSFVTDTVGDDSVYVYTNEQWILIGVE
jgi:hypothetical protein